MWVVFAYEDTNNIRHMQLLLIATLHRMAWYETKIFLQCCCHIADGELLTYICIVTERDSVKSVIVVTVEN